MSVTRSTTLVTTEKSKKILDGLPCNLVQTFVLSFWESVQNVALC